MVRCTSSFMFALILLITSSVLISSSSPSAVEAANLPLPAFGDTQRTDLLSGVNYQAPLPSTPEYHPSAPPSTPALLGLAGNLDGIIGLENCSATAVAEDIKSVDKEQLEDEEHPRI